MWTNNLLYLAFFMQVIFISWYMPKFIVEQSKKILDKHPEKQYPKLYPVSRDAIDMSINNFKIFNRVILMLGIYIIAYGAYSQSDEMLNVDSSAVLIGFFLLQYVPFLIMEFTGFKFLKLMRLANKQTIRKAELQPRKMLDYFSPLYLSILVVSNLVFISVIEYFVQNPFEHFGGYLNLAVLVFIDGFMLSIIAWNIYGKTKNPHLSAKDQTLQIEKIVKISVLTIVMVTVFMTLELIMSATGTRYLMDTLMSIYFLLLAFIGMSAYRLDNLNFEVYREG